MDVVTNALTSQAFYAQLATASEQLQDSSAQTQRKVPALA